MAKKKKSTAAAAKSSKDRSGPSSSSNHAATSSSNNNRFAVIGAALFVTLCCSIGAVNFKSLQSTLSSFQSPTSPPPPSESTGELFLKWFTDNGGIFHPISSSTAANDDDDASSGVQITIHKFDGLGWGLAAIFNATSTFDSTFSNEGNDDACESASQNDESCPSPSQQLQPATTLIIPHLAPLFTVPSNLIISISSILDTYASPSNDYYLPNFYHVVNKVLLASFPRGQGLAKMSSPNNNRRSGNNVRMGLVEQDVVIAMMLMTEECLHHHHDDDDSTNGSFWGPYLNMLSSTPIPRLDTFDTEEYAMLNDATLEMVGRSSKERLKSMFYGNARNSGGDDDVSVKTVLRDMINIQQRTNKNNNPAVVPPTCLEFDTFHKFIGIVSSRAMVLKGIKYLTPLAEMINYSPVSPLEQVVHPSRSSGELDECNAPAQQPPPHDGSAEDTTTATTTTIQIFEITVQSTPVSSSKCMPSYHNNPYHCAVIHGRHFLRRQVAPGRSDPNSNLTQFVSLEDVCVRKDMTIVEDGNMIGRRPASDAIAITSLLLGESTDMFSNLEVLKSKCITAIESNDVERIELQCARYPGSRRIVKLALVNAAQRSVSEADVTMETLSSWLEEAEKEGGEGGNEKLALAVRFRIEERKIIDSISDISLIDDEPLKHVVIDASDDDLEAKLSSFNTFMDSLNLPVNKIRAQAVEGMRLGAIATEDLESEDAYISLPPNTVIDATSAVAEAETSSPRLAALLKKLDSQQSDGFDVMLVYLLHERFVRKDDSEWWPYLDLLPTVQEVSSSHPLFFEEDEMNLHLGGSDVRKFILRNQGRAFERHAALASDVDVHEVLGSDVILDKSIVYWATAMLDSRSIWWDGRRHLTPLLDLVNADSIGRAHETKVEESSAVTRVSRPVKRGEQVFENYQQPNYLLFAFHGFLLESLESNPSDCALLGGLSINHNDPGAKFASRLQSSPTFCISGTNIDSMEELAQFLRMKHGLSTNKLESESWLNEDVVPYLTQVLKERISRLGDLTESGTELEDEPTQQRRLHIMSRMAISDLAHFQAALELLKERVDF
ncbi:SET domain-containing protein [Skeletonema marinoi]|uniref:SET domain-containing protein n=2 Tax=Skeletonema marinoi TaxID=267567 RepID=A0AAD8XUL9_9STRA|nr:SET domain-containing protein [Skeletonema marinoi]